MSDIQHRLDLVSSTCQHMSVRREGGRRLTLRFPLISDGLGCSFSALSDDIVPGPKIDAFNEGDKVMI